MYPATALIAEDEPLLAQALQAELARAWPELQVLRTVGDGISAVEATLALTPQVLFFDIRMPGKSGLDAALELADLWPPAHAPHQAFPALVFVTAYDQYAVQAFEAQAVDYLLKPVQGARLQKTIAKLQQSLGASASAALDGALRQLRGLMLAPQQATTSTEAPSAAEATPLRLLQVSAGNQIRMVPLDDVLYLEAADKYLRVRTADHEYLLRTPLKELLPRLDPQVFWQIHRGTVVRASAIDALTRDEAGRLTLSLRDCKDKLSVSRLYAQRFKAM